MLNSLKQGSRGLTGLVFMILFTIVGGLPLAQGSKIETRTVSLSNGQFNINGKQTQIISGDLHYARIPRAYWRDRLLRMKAMGLNAVTTYVFWNLHEPAQGTYDFTGGNDVAAFIREAQAVGLFVILRPGPYVCAEWEMGGFPSWLLKNKETLVRTSDPRFMVPAATWMRRLGRELAPLQYTKGGPIIAVQIENEYGSFGHDQRYLEQVHQMVVSSGFDSSVLFTSNGIKDIKRGSIPGIATVVNFGPGEAKKAFKALYQFQSGLLMMSGEYWAGWFDAWGGHHHVGNIAQEAQELEWMLRQGYSVNLYMFHGGTSFGWMNGADSTFFHRYMPDVTSYDYDAALDESGRATAKFYAFKKVIEAHNGTTAPQLAPELPVAAIGAVPLSESASLWDNLPKPVVSHELLTMEDLDQSFGYILYRKILRETSDGELVIDGLHDYAEIYLDGERVGNLDRRLGEQSLWLKIKKSHVRLDILVENTGRIGHSHELQKERKGVTKQIVFNSVALKDWQIFSLPMSQRSDIKYAKKLCDGPCFYRASFVVNTRADTFLDTRELSKGFVWINGQALGRFWEIGPQRTLYLPAPFLATKENLLEVFDLHGANRVMHLQGLRQPILH